MKVLLVLPPTFAEIICSTALIRCLKKQVAGLELHVLIDAAVAFALEANFYIDHLLVTEKAHTTFAAKSFDLLIDLAALEENRHWAKEAGARYLTLKQTGFFDFFKRFGTSGKQMHLAAQYLEVAKPLGVHDDGLGLDYFVPQTATIKPHDIPTAHSAGYIALVLDADQEFSFPVVRAFCRQIKHPVILIGGIDVAGIGGAVSQVDPIKIYSACGKFSANETADLLKRSKLVVTPENGWMQVAAALKKPLVALRQTKATSLYFPPFYPRHTLQAGTCPYVEVVGFKKLHAQKEDNDLSANDARLLDALLLAVQEQLREMH